GIETSNLYAAFLAIAVELLEPGGELVAITPRSFCNGPYFKAFRKLFLGTMAFRRIHIFESREEAFKDDEVLQENIIFHAVKTDARERVLLSTSPGPSGDGMTGREVEYRQVIDPDDPDQIIHLATSQMDSFVRERLSQFRFSLAELGIGVSTGRVVDFRAREFLRDVPDDASAPLIYPIHFANGGIQWPKLDSRKPNAIAISDDTNSLFLPSGDYVLVKRFSSKEEPRRVVAALYDSEKIAASVVGFENHLNVYHCNHAGLPKDVARGLTLFLNSTLIDSYFRQFNGHTQVNATDLKKLSYPALQMLAALGRHTETKFPSQQKIDELVEREIQQMADIQSPNPVSAKRKIEETMRFLESLGFPKGQQNERSALTLLALLDLKPGADWSEASEPLIGITPIMDFCRDHYGRQYAPNTRETFRRQTMHQFVQAGLAIPNPDDPGRPVNSPKYCYQIEPNALALCRKFDSPAWNDGLRSYLLSVDTLKQRYARAREMKMLPVTLAEGQELYLTPGDHSSLVKAILDEFAPRFVPGGHVLYVGDTGGKWRYFDEEAMGRLGVTIDVHGKMPDVVIHHIKKGWLVLIEAVTSHGPVDPKRREELAILFRDSSAGLVYVTAFLRRSDMAKYVSEISWKTEVWVQEASTHLIHFNGERFLGPYES
nr:BsuBI/PstI family type II restriction endonuclease [Caldilineaceae bacterium]